MPIEPTVSKLEDERRLSTRTVFWGIALVLPWIIVDVVLKKQDPSFGYFWGTTVGAIATYISSPAPQRFWRSMALFTAMFAIGHFYLMPRL